MVLALAVGVVLSPLSAFWERHGFSSAAGALSSLVLAVVAMAGLALILQPLVQQVIDTAPKVWADVQDLILGFRKVARELAAVSSGVSQAGSPGVDATAAAPGGTAPAPVAVAAG